LRLSELLLLVHDTARAPGHVNEFLRKAGWYVDALAGSLSTVDRRKGSFRYIDFFSSIPEKAATYQERYSADDPVKLAMIEAEPHRFIPLGELLPPRVIETHPYFSKWLAGLGLHDVVTARIPVSEQHSCLLGFVRAKGQAPFGRAEIEFLDTLLPHTELALITHGHIDRLGVLADLAQEYFLQAGYGLAVLSEDGQVLFSNRFARSLLEDGSAVEMRDGRIRLRDAQANQRFDELVRQCISASDTRSVLAGGSLTALRAAGSALAISVLPFRRQTGAQTVVASGSRAMVLLYDPDRPRIDNRSLLREMYRLSEAESEVCWRIGAGETVDEIVAATGGSRETVRSQVKRVFTKTGVNRQADLVRLVLLGSAIVNRLR
jgi:DNA-binding CsgD family transcriptional regulator